MFTIIFSKIKNIIKIFPFKSLNFEILLSFTGEIAIKHKLTKSYINNIDNKFSLSKVPYNSVLQKLPRYDLLLMMLEIERHLFSPKSKEKFKP